MHNPVANPYSITDQWESKWTPQQRERMRELKAEVMRDMDIVHKEIGYVAMHKDTGKIETDLTFYRKKMCKFGIKEYGLENTHKPMKIKITWELI